VTATTRNGFDSVSQSGSAVAWTGLSNMVYPTEGEGACELTAVAQTANELRFSIPTEASGIPSGAAFVSASLYSSVKKTGAFSSATSVYWTFAMSSSTSTPFAYTLSTDESYIDRVSSGDATDWRISGVYSPADIIEKLKDGTMYFKVNASTTAAIACGIRINEVTVIVEYETVSGERAALVATLV